MLQKFQKFLFNTTKISPKLIQVKIKYDGNIFSYQFPLHTKLASNLQKMKVALDFQCGFGCSCGTCPVQIDTEQNFKKIKESQPISQNELLVLRQNSFKQNVRLSCQLFVQQNFKDIIFSIED